MTPGERWAAAVASLPRGAVVVRGGEGEPLDETRSWAMVGGDAASMSQVLAGVRADLDAVVLAAAAPRDGERVLPTAVGGPGAWARACGTAAAEGRGLDDPYAVVVLLAPAPADAERWLLRSAGALQTSLRAHDVVCRDGAAWLVLAPRWPAGDAAVLGERLTAALLAVGVAAAVGVAVGPVPAEVEPTARAAAHDNAAGRRVVRL